MLFVLKGNSAELEKFKHIAIITIPSLVIIGIYIYIVIR